MDLMEFCYEGGPGLGPCQLPGFGISDVEVSGTATDNKLVSSSYK
jgi:hypothetical protein